MQLFLDTISLVGGFAVVIVAAFIVIALFVCMLMWFGNKKSNSKSISIDSVLDNEQLVSVYLKGNSPLKDVRFVGITDAESVTTRLPGQLGGMIVLEDEQKRSYLVRANDIRMIVVASANED